ncbi:DNA cytosine methyltransferase [Falsiruegeria litorea]|uniref:DNA cytosine methyltransferase n=1 Tax=Falsiruegeria litorea TaxID=1280831 RepID=UPI001BFE7101|nr:DNA cytosine methyltransferase [Falsiruegeria litorea]MBT8169899.1 DNA cytosine methyltransferase [Falsiruegeria litorea]
MQNAPKYIDLFSGCGGLSLGLEAAGFKLVVAVEKSDMAAETFYHNFIGRIPSKEFWKNYSSKDTSVATQAKSKLIVKELQALLDSPEVVDNLRSRDIDLIAGGPPCQGFSLAGRRDPDDARNQLPWQFIELVEKITPKMVLIENVSGIRQNFNKYTKESPFENLKKALECTAPGYVVQSLLVNAMHFGAPQHRPRVMLVGLRSDIAADLEIRPAEIWHSEYDDVAKFPNKKRPFLAPRSTHFGRDILTVKDAIWDLGEAGYLVPSGDASYRRASALYAKKLRTNREWMPETIAKVAKNPNVSNHVLRKHADRIKKRFRLYQYLQREGLSPKLLNIPAHSDGDLERKHLELYEHINNCTLPAVAPDGTIIANSKRELSSLIIELQTKKHSQRPLFWNKPSPTIVSLPEDFVHPQQPRTMTVREMARFQSFPDTFEFRAKETTGSLRRRFEVPQYTQVGNAVPPLLGEAVGKRIHEILEQHTELLRNR